MKQFFSLAVIYSFYFSFKLKTLINSLTKEIEVKIKVFRNLLENIF